MSASAERVQSVDDQTECALFIVEGYRDGVSARKVNRRETGPLVDVLRLVARHMRPTKGKGTRHPVASSPHFRIEFADGLWISHIDIVDMVACLEGDLIYPGWVSERVRSAPKSK